MLTIHDGTTVQESELLALKITLDYVEFVGEIHARVSGRTGPCHITWNTGTSVDHSHPELNAHKLLSDGPHLRRVIKFILCVMRYPGLYDGGVEFMFERRIWPAVKHLFGPWCANCSP